MEGRQQYVFQQARGLNVSQCSYFCSGHLMLEECLICNVNICHPLPLNTSDITNLQCAPWCNAQYFAYTTFFSACQDCYYGNHVTKKKKKQIPWPGAYEVQCVYACVSFLMQSDCKRHRQAHQYCFQCSPLTLASFSPSKFIRLKQQ